MSNINDISFGNHYGAHPLTDQLANNRLRDYELEVKEGLTKFLHLNKLDKNIKCFCVGSVTEKIARLSGFTKTISASGNVNALKNLIINSEEVKKNDKLAYICGDQITLELDKELHTEGFKVKKFIT